MKKFDQKLNEFEKEVSILKEVDTSTIGRFFGSLVQGVQQGRPVWEPKYKIENVYVLLGGAKSLDVLRKALNVEKGYTFDPSSIKINDILVGAQNPQSAQNLNGLYKVFKVLPNNQIRVGLINQNTQALQQGANLFNSERTNFAGFYNENSTNPTDPAEALPVQSNRVPPAFSSDGKIINPQTLAISLYNAFSTVAKYNPQDVHVTIDELTTGKIQGKTEQDRKFGGEPPSQPYSKIHPNLMEYIHKNANNLIAYMTPNQAAEAAKGSLFKQTGTALSKSMTSGVKNTLGQVWQQATTSQNQGGGGALNI